MRIFSGLIVAIVTVATGFVLTSGVASSQSIDGSLNCGGNKISLGSDCKKPTAAEGSGQIETLIKTIINVISAIVGAVAVIMVLIGGFRFVTAGGDSNNVSGAKNTILYAIVGLVIVAFAQVIVRFVLQRV